MDGDVVFVTTRMSRRIQAELDAALAAGDVCPAA